jgi:hypothetical protein
VALKDLCALPDYGCGIGISGAGPVVAGVEVLSTGAGDTGVGAAVRSGAGELKTSFAGG